MKADRFNEGKPKYSLLSLKEMEPCVKVLEFGANKYARDNWKKGLPLSEILDSMLRHISAMQSGEMIDPESGLPHIGHIQCNALFLGGLNNTNDLVHQKQPLQETHSLKGVRFKHRASDKPIYTIYDVVDDKVHISWANGENATHYSVQDTLKYFEREIWIRV